MQCYQYHRSCNYRCAVVSHGHVYSIVVCFMTRSSSSALVDVVPSYWRRQHSDVAFEQRNRLSSMYSCAVVSASPPFNQCCALHDTIAATVQSVDAMPSYAGHHRHFVLPAPSPLRYQRRAVLAFADCGMIPTSISLMRCQPSGIHLLPFLYLTPFGQTCA